MSHQRKHGCRSCLRGAVEIRLRGRPPPILIAAEDAVGEIVQQLQIAGRWIRREAAVAHHLGRNPLPHFLAPVFEYLKIRVAMRINEARRDSQTAAVDHARIGRGFEGVKPGDRLAGNEQIAAPRWRSGTINQCAASK